MNCLSAISWRNKLIYSSMAISTIKVKKKKGKPPRCYQPPTSKTPSFVVGLPGTMLLSTNAPIPNGPRTSQVPLFNNCYFDLRTRSSTVKPWINVAWSISACAPTSLRYKLNHEQVHEHSAFKTCILQIWRHVLMDIIHESNSVFHLNF